MNRFYVLIYTIVKPFVCLLFPFRVRGLERLPTGGAVLCANHVSAADPVLIAVALPKDAWLRFMAKKELFGNRLVGWFLRKCGAFPVNRGENDMSAIKTALKCLQSGEKLMIFPEGTPWGEEEAKIVIGVAGVGEEHLEILGIIADKILDEASAAKLVDKDTDVDTVYRILGGEE